MGFYKFPRTPHLEDYDVLRGCHLVITEKLDGANAGISFGNDGKLRLQSRGKYLSGGEHAQFNPFKNWAYGIAHKLWPILKARYVLYGEWLYAKHTIFYNRLPTYFLAFDVLDRESGEFLDTAGRYLLLHDAVYHVPLMGYGEYDDIKARLGVFGQSAFIAPGHGVELANLATQIGLDPARVLAETDTSGLMEGQYIKVESGGIVTARYKLVRGGFKQCLEESGHWARRPVIPNQLMEVSDVRNSVCTER